MLRALNGDPGCIDLSFPLEYFSHYTDISTYYRQHPENTADSSRSKLSDSDLEAINSLEVNMERDGQQYLSRVRFMADSGNEVTYLTYIHIPTVVEVVHLRLYLFFKFMEGKIT